MVKGQLLGCGAAFGTLVSSLFASHEASASTECFSCDGILPRHRGDSDGGKYQGPETETMSPNKAFFSGSLF